MNYSYDIIPFEQMINPRFSTLLRNPHPETTRSKEVLKKKPNKRRKKTRRRKQVRNYWTSLEQQAYVRFLFQNMEIMQKNLKQRRKYCINMMMSQAIKTRNQRQCHSHHQKMIKKFGTLQAIVSAFECEISFAQDSKQSFSTKRLENQLSKEISQMQRDEASIELQKVRKSQGIDLAEFGFTFQLDQIQILCLDSEDIAHDL